MPVCTFWTGILIALILGMLSSLRFTNRDRDFTTTKRGVPLAMLNERAQARA